MGVWYGTVDHCCASYGTGLNPSDARGTNFFASTQRRRIIERGQRLMCGICLWVDQSDNRSDAVDSPPSWLLRRGPDDQGRISWNRVTLQASVLCMREELISQPVSLHNDDGGGLAYLCWNGEVYQSTNYQISLTSSNGVAGDATNATVDGAAGEPSVSDTRYVADLLRQIISSQVNQRPESLMPKLVILLQSLVNAEFAFCLATADWIYYGKDPWGRRSLLTGVDSDQWCLASVADKTHEDLTWKEVEAGIVFAYNISSGSMHQLKYSNTSLPLMIARQDPSEELCKLLSTAVQRRIAGNQQVAVLFSGGLDSVVLAALALQERRKVTLINVSFVFDKNGQYAKESAAADTRAAIASYRELVKLFPDSLIDFQQRQVSWNEVEHERRNIAQLIFPKETVMDFNIATAFWFAADAVDARILLSGLGADEQMGGYGRHRKAWERGGDQALREELQKDQSRLWERNLGRDDRVLSDTQKEARYPFLDTAVVNFLASLELDKICDFTLPPGQGDKKILRSVAEKLGLMSASKAIKRAIQFGSRIAHVSDKKTFGSRRKAIGEARYGGTSSG